MNLTTLRKWHWMSAALCFTCMLLFSVTGITLHHARDWLPKAVVTHSEGNLPTNIQSGVSAKEIIPNQQLSNELQQWIRQSLAIKAPVEKIEEKNELYNVNLNSPGKTRTLIIDFNKGVYLLDISDRGWFGYLNDLHKGKGTGKAWIYFIDLFAIACIIFSITGFLLLQRYATTRAQTWPLLIASFMLPLFFLVALVH